MAASLYDAVVVGGGPAGLTAALYLARARYRVLVVEKEAFGGQITITADVVNYPGVEHTDGRSLTDTMRRQAASFGAEFLLAEVTGIEGQGDVKTVHTSAGDLSCFAVLLATGAHPRTVGFKGEEEFRGRGVAYCATCDGEFFTGRDLFVVGGGFAAAEEAMFLTRYARHVTILVRREAFSCALSVVDQVMRHEAIDVLFNTELVAVEGDTAPTRAVLRNTKDGSLKEHVAAQGESFGVFVFAGYLPSSGLARGLADLDDQGYIVVDNDQKTSAPGIYAAGDVCVKKLRQVVTAVADGAIAATSMERHAAAMQERTGLRPERPASATPPPAAAHGAGASAQAHESGTPAAGQADAFLSAEQRAQLAAVFARMERPLRLQARLDDRRASADLRRLLEELAGLSDKLSLDCREGGGGEKDLPCVRILAADGTDTGIAFHGAPGGHEFNSFVVALYNAGGPGQAVDAGTARRMAAIGRPVSLKVLVSLSCTMCPELVMAAQHLAAANPLVRAEAYDVALFPALRERYRVMSVPCLVVDDNGRETVAFGKKSLARLLDLLETGQA